MKHKRSSLEAKFFRAGNKGITDTLEKQRKEQKEQEREERGIPEDEWRKLERDFLDERYTE